MQYFVVFLSNPGYVMVKNAAEDAAETHVEFDESDHLVSGNNSVSPTVPIAQVEDKKSEPVKNHFTYCTNCDAWKAPRSKHCYQCGHCIVKFGMEFFVLLLA